MAEGKWRFRQLYVNEKLCTRARTPNEGFLHVAGFPEGTSKTVHYHTDCGSFEYAAGDIDPKWTNLDDVEVIVYHFWTDSHLPIKSIDTEKRIVAFKHKAGKVFTDDFTTDGIGTSSRTSRRASIGRANGIWTAKQGFSATCRGRERTWRQPR